MLYIHQNATIKNPGNIILNGSLQVGVSKVGFMNVSDITHLNIQGQLVVKGDYSIARGCRLDIGKDAVVSIGKGGHMNANTKLIIMHSLTIGNECVISWDCQFLDEDFHHLQYKEKKERPNGILVGHHVWIGCGAKIYKGTVIPDDCIIASDAVVRGVFTQTNCIIGGNPAKVIKEGVTWS